VLEGASETMRCAGPASVTVRPSPSVRVMGVGDGAVVGTGVGASVGVGGTAVGVGTTVGLHAPAQTPRANVSANRIENRLWDMAESLR